MLQRCAPCQDIVQGPEPTPIGYSYGKLTITDDGGSPCSITITCSPEYVDDTAVTVLSLTDLDGAVMQLSDSTGIGFDGESVTQKLYCNSDGTYLATGSPSPVSPIVFCECKRPCYT